MDAKVARPDWGQACERYRTTCEFLRTNGGERETEENIPMASEDLLRRMPERLDRREGDMTAAVSQNEADKREGERGVDYCSRSSLNDPSAAGHQNLFDDALRTRERSHPAASTSQTPVLAMRPSAFASAALPPGHLH